MRALPKLQPIHRRKLSRVAYVIYLVLMIPICSEIALRIMGYQPFQQVEYKIEASPENCLIAHPTLGFALQPGDFKVTINQGLHYTVRHGGDSLRLTPRALKKNVQDSIYFFGCSYTYGMGLNDSLTFPFLVSQNLPHSLIKNFGVPGYGTIQAYLQLKRLFASQEIPNIVIINYADFHDDRNALTARYRRDLYMGYQGSNESVKTLMQESKVPFLTKKSEGYVVDFCSWKDLYDHWKYRETFALVNFFQDWSDRNQMHSIDKEAYTRYLFSMIKDMCEQEKIRLIVTGITPSEETKSLLKDLNDEGIEILDISVDLSSDQYRNAPFDDHPNELAHAFFAKKITAYLVP